MARDSEARGTLLTWLQPTVVRYCRARIGRTGDGEAYSTADDVAQEVFVALLGALDRYTDAPESFLPFVYGIASHKVADHYRRAARNRSELAADVPDSVDPDAGPEQLAMAAELRGRLGDLLRSLPPVQQQILHLRLVVGLSAQETAELLGLTPVRVRLAQHRALARLRSSISPAEWA
ncbi:sigma-70 family RNA polymerase sigma factor [Actinokineospora soli]|uniref:Sigma-70 family RNA polymerase sigma factor n=1 Tax=Actinokineospora soli TaxID=1048753 RepID=A0ABW2TI91_9PSEU